MGTPNRLSPIGEKGVVRGVHVDLKAVWNRLMATAGRAGNGRAGSRGE